AARVRLANEVPVGVVRPYGRSEDPQTERPRALTGRHDGPRVRGVVVGNHDLQRAESRQLRARARPWPAKSVPVGIRFREERRAIELQKQARLSPAAIVRRRLDRKETARAVRDTTAGRSLDVQRATHDAWFVDKVGIARVGRALHDWARISG